MKFINIVTPYDGYNYGAMLQAYALRSSLEKITGKSVGIYEYPVGTLKQSKTLKGYVAELMSLPQRGNIRLREKRTDAFKKKWFFLNDEDANIYICGSDQIWNPNNIQSKFYLDFVKKGTTKASYAASMGVSNTEPEKLATISKMLMDFDFISVREPEAKQMLQKYVDKDINVHADPTLLLKKEEWYELERPVPGLRSGYILIYLLHIPTDAQKVINELKRRLKEPVVLIDASGNVRYLIHSDKAISSAGPEEFLWLFHNAGYVVTSSFHGTAFSIIYQKSFATLINSSSPSRISNLLKIAGIDRGSIYHENLDYTKISKCVDDEQRRSVEYLTRIVNNG